MLFPVKVREPGEGETPKRSRQDNRAPHPSPLQGGRGRKATLHCFPSPGRLERNAMFSCFQLTSPHQQPSAFLRPGVKTATGGELGRANSGGGWAWGEKVTPPQDPHTHPRTPPARLSGLGADPWALSEGRGGGPPHIPRESWGRPRRPLGRKLANKGAGHRPVTLGPYSCFPHFPPNPPKSGSTHSREAHSPAPPGPTPHELL